MLNKSSKKAQIEISFNWIFVLIAGAIILFFFIRVINSEVEMGESASQSRTVVRMNSLLSAIQQNPDSVTDRYIFNYELEFECELGRHAYGVAGSSTKPDLPHQILFSPEIIGDSRIIAWVKTFNAPFPLASTLYITDEKTQYVFITNSDLNNRMTYYYNLFPNNISKKLTTLENFVSEGDQGYRRYILIINDAATGQIFSFGNNRFAAKVPYIVALNEGQKEIIFYEFGQFNFLNPSESTTKEYFTEESIIGAMITGNPDLYECTMTKMLEQLRITADINKERIARLYTAYPQGHSCTTMYSTISQNHFGNMSDAAKTKDYVELKDSYDEIRALNSRILRTSCVSIY